MARVIPNPWCCHSYLCWRCFYESESYFWIPLRSSFPYGIPLLTSEGF